jgi:hypothetical protein
VHKPLALSACLAGLIATASPARAELDARLIAKAAGGGPIPAAFTSADGLIPLLVELPAGADARAGGLIPAAPGFAALRLRPEQLGSWADAHPELRLWWAPPRRPLLDTAANWTWRRCVRTIGLP